MPTSEHLSDSNLLSRREFLLRTGQLGTVLAAQSLEDQIGAKASFAISHRHRALALVGRQLDRALLHTDEIPPFTVLSPRQFSDVYSGDLHQFPQALDVGVRSRPGTTDIDLDLHGFSGFHELETADSSTRISNGSYRNSGSALISSVAGNQEWCALFQQKENLAVVAIGYESGSLYMHSRQVDEWGRVIVLDRDSSVYPLRTASQWNPYFDSLQGSSISQRVTSFSHRINEGAQTLRRLGHRPYPYVLRDVDIEGKASVTFGKDEFVTSEGDLFKGRRYIHSESPGTIVDLQHAGYMARLRLRMTGHLLAQSMAKTQDPRLLYDIGNPHTPVAIEYGVALPNESDYEAMAAVIDTIMDDGSMRMEAIAQGGLSTVLPFRRLSASSFSSEDTHSNLLGKVYADAWIRDSGVLDHLTQSLSYYSGLRRATPRQLSALVDTILAGQIRVLGTDVLRQIARDGGVVPVEEDITISTKGIYGQIPVTERPGSVDRLYRRPRKYSNPVEWRVVRTPAFEHLLPFALP